MGMYTHLVLNVNFNENTPQEVIDTIKYMVGDKTEKPHEQNHDLFDCPRWPICLCCDSWYFMGVTNTSFECHQDIWQLTVNANCKNYSHEYEEFLDYIQPYIDEGEFLGFIRYEEWDHPILIYNTSHGIEYVSPEIKLVGKLW